MFQYKIIHNILTTNNNNLYYYIQFLIFFMAHGMKKGNCLIHKMINIRNISLSIMRAALPVISTCRKYKCLQGRKLPKLGSYGCTKGNEVHSTREWYFY